MADQMKHPWDKSIYTDREDGTVTVDTVDGRRGHFDVEGRWLDGELKTVDPEFARWVISGWILKQNILAAKLKESAR
jgi:hypothetical protein